jgi:hypothetical protein
VNITYDFRVERNCVSGVESFIASLYAQSSYKLAEKNLLVGTITQITVCRFMFMDDKVITLFPHAFENILKECFKTTEGWSYLINYIIHLQCRENFLLTSIPKILWTPYCFQRPQIISRITTLMPFKITCRCIHNLLEFTCAKSFTSLLVC